MWSRQLEHAHILEAPDVAIFNWRQLRIEGGLEAALHGDNRHPKILE